MDSKFHEFCSRHFRYSDLIACGETWGRLHSDCATPTAAFLPIEPESWSALSALAAEVLDCVLDHFGAVELTYGFAGPAMARRVSGRIAPSLDQHAAHERNAAGNHICSRLGAAVDFRVPGTDSFDVAKWVAERLHFDRIYMYEADRPIHVSLGPEMTRGTWWMRSYGDNRRTPVRVDPTRPATWQAK